MSKLINSWLFVLRFRFHFYKHGWTLHFIFLLSGCVEGNNNNSTLEGRMKRKAKEGRNLRSWWCACFQDEFSGFFIVLMRTHATFLWSPPLCSSPKSAYTNVTMLFSRFCARGRREKWNYVSGPLVCFPLFSRIRFCIFLYVRIVKIFFGRNHACRVYILFLFGIKRM